MPCHRIAADDDDDEDDDEDNDSVSNSAFFDEDNNSNSVNLAATGASEDGGTKEDVSGSTPNVGRKNKRKNFRPRNILTSGGDENANGGEVPGGGGGGVGVGEEQGWSSVSLCDHPIRGT